MANVISKTSGLKRTTLSKHLKDSIYARDGKCMQCGLIYSGSRVDFEIDHIIPLSMGGSDKDVNNFQLLCKKCNRKKGNSTLLPVISKENTALKKINMDGLDMIPELHRPLVEDVYSSLIILYVAISDIKFSSEEIVWFNMPYSIVELFMERYTVNKQDIISMMQRVDFYPLCEDERRRKEKILRIAQVNTIKRQSDNLMAIAMLRKIEDEEKKSDDKPQIIFNINNAVLQNLQQLEDYGNK